MRALVPLFVLALSTTAIARPKAPTVVDVFNAIDTRHRIKKAGASWTTGSKITVTVDLRNGYLTFVDPKTKVTTTAALWKASNDRWFLGIADDGPSVSFWESDGAGDTPEEVQDTPIPAIQIDDLLMPAADAKLVEANAKAFPDGIKVHYELPRKGTTIIAHVDLPALHKAVEDAGLAAPTKTKVLAIVDNSVNTRIELDYDDGHFRVGKASKP